MALRARQRSQAIVEFGLIALLFTALMFATVDFGLLLNTWQAVSSGTRDIARNASVGKPPAKLADEAGALTMPGVDKGYGSSCPPCLQTSAMWLTVDYFTGCMPGTSGCNALKPPAILVLYGGGCVVSALTPICHPTSDDMVQITLVAQGAQIITPLLRPFFGCTNGVNPKCYVSLTSRAIMRFEGQEFP